MPFVFEDKKEQVKQTGRFVFEDELLETLTAMTMRSIQIGRAHV